MSHGPFLRSLREYGLRGTFEKLYKMRTIKFGRLIGVDRFGNQYFENTADYPHGQHRWVEYAGNKNFYEVDASYIAPEWHGWIHGTTAEPPTEKHTGSTYKVEPQANAHGSSAPYARNLGGVINAPTPNLSQFRPRGFGLSNNVFPESLPNQELFYTQPGWPLEKRNAAVRVSARKGRIGFSLRDTPLTIKARAAAKHGLSVEEYERYSHPFSPTRIALLTVSGAEAASAGTPAATSEVIEQALQTALPDARLPTRPEAKVVGVKLAAGDALDGSEAGTFAATVAGALTRDELALLDSGLDIMELSLKAGDLSAMIERYALVPGKDSARGIEKATAALDAARADIAALHAVHAKLAALEASFEGRVAETAAAEAARRSAMAAGRGDLQ